MVTKVILVRDSSISRSLTVVLPEGVSGERLVELLNSGAITEDHVSLQSADGGIKARVEGSGITADTFVWRLDSTFEAEAAPEHDHAHEHGCGCGDHCTPPTESEKLLRQAESLSQLVLDACQRKDLRSARRAQALAETYYELAEGGISDAYIWLLSGRSFIAQTAGQLKAAGKHARYVLKITRAMHGDGEIITAVVGNNYGEVLVEQSNFAQAEHILRAGIAVLDKAIADNHPHKSWASSGRADALNNLRRALEGLGRTEEAAALV